MLSINRFQILFSDEKRQDEVSEWNESCNDNGEDHLDVVILCETNDHQDCELDEFNDCELVDNPLRDSANVVGRWICALNENRLSNQKVKRVPVR